ncbi:hypothetical protein [Actinomyces israelii]|uniref:hypothetical protein n=1 Tax=Actinomyces israelii TaxID=1659 RepID=UPI000693D8E2|nr:hypothetical protein [Actinomyces israelii]
MPASGGRPARKPSRRSTQVRRNSLVVAWIVVAAVLAVLVIGGPLGSWGTWLPLHALMLGGIGSAITVWSAHFADTLLHRPALGGAALLDARLYAHGAGTALVLAGTTASLSALTMVGATVVALAALTGALAIAVQYRRAVAPRLAALAIHYAVALTLLALGAALGYLTSRAGARGRAHLSDILYVAHTTTMLLGFVGTTVLGTLTVLWPTMLRTKMEPGAPRWSARGLPLLVAGTALVAASGALAPLAALGTAVYLAGACGVIVPAARSARRVPPTSFATASATAAVTWFLIGVVRIGTGVGALALGDAGPADRAAAAREVIHGVRVLLAAGFALQVLAGALSYLSPVMLGGGPATTRATNAIMDRAAAYRVVAANACLALALLTALPWEVRLSGAVTAGAVAAYVPVGMGMSVREAVRRSRGPSPRPGPGRSPAAHRLPQAQEPPQAQESIRERADE